MKATSYLFFFIINLFVTEILTANQDFIVYHDYEFVVNEEKIVFEEKIKTKFYCKFIDDCNTVERVSFYLVDDKNEVLYHEKWETAEIDTLINTLDVSIDKKESGAYYYFVVQRIDETTYDKGSRLYFRVQDNQVLPVKESLKDGRNKINLIFMFDEDYVPDDPFENISLTITRFLSFDSLFYQNSYLFNFYYSAKTANANDREKDRHRVDNNVAKLVDSTKYIGIAILHRSGIRDYYREYNKNGLFRVFSADIPTSIQNNDDGHLYTFIHEYLHCAFGLNDEYRDTSPNRPECKYERELPKWPNMFKSESSAHKYCNSHDDLTIDYRVTPICSNEFGHWHNICGIECVMHNSKISNPIVGQGCRKRIYNKIIQHYY